MRLLIVLSLIFLLSNCTKPKTVLICGDHICLNKAEAEQYFEENLSIEVKIIDSKNNKELDLVEINLKKETKGKKRINIASKPSTNKEIKTLTKSEIVKIKENIKRKKKEKKITKKKIEKDFKEDKKIKEKQVKSKIDRKEKLQTNVNNKQKKIVDICTIIEKCSIDEISKYLIKEGKKKGFPDITTRQ